MNKLSNDVAEPAQRRPEIGRFVALRSAGLTGLLMLVAAMAVGEFHPWMVIAGLTGVLLSVVLVPRRRISAALASPVTEREARAPGVADAVLAHIPDPVILVDQRAIVLEANEAATSLLPGLKIAHPLSFALRSPVVLDGIDAVLASGGPLRVEYSEHVPTERTFEVHIGLLRPTSQFKAPAGVVLFFRDLTSARRLEAMRTDFVANASHELRTPLASLLGFVETLQGPARNDAAARERFLDIMRQQAQRMTRLIDDLLSLSRIEMRLHVPPAATIDLTAITSHMVEALSSLAIARGVTLGVHVPTKEVLVLGDRDELLRLLENLITNAVKYGETGGKVDITLSETASHAVLVVQDYGRGIAPEHLPRLTERFYRVDVEQSREKGGTGLGLAIVKHIVNRHRGALEIDSDPGAGSRFTVKLPLVPEQPR